MKKWVSIPGTDSTNTRLCIQSLINISLSLSFCIINLVSGPQNTSSVSLLWFDLTYIHRTAGNIHYTDNNGQLLKEMTASLKTSEFPTRLPDCAAQPRKKKKDAHLLRETLRSSSFLYVFLQLEPGELYRRSGGFYRQRNTLVHCWFLVFSRDFKTVRKNMEHHQPYPHI